MQPRTPLARRLVLSAPEWAALVALSAVTMPPGFKPAAFDEATLFAATQTLIKRQVITAEPKIPQGGVLVDAVAVNVAVLAAPLFTVQVEVAVDGKGLRAVYAIAGQFGVSVFTLADQAVELSMFAADTLGIELIRVVPDLHGLTPAQNLLDDALGGGDHPALAGRLPLAAVQQQPGQVELELSTGEAALAARLRTASVGTLSCLVSGHSTSGVQVGCVVWVATVRGWIGLRPDPDDTGRHPVRVEPVNRADLGLWVAPLVAQLLDGNG